MGFQKQANLLEFLRSSSPLGDRECHYNQGETIFNFPRNNVQNLFSKKDLYWAVACKGLFLHFFKKNNVQNHNFQIVFLLRKQIEPYGSLPWVETQALIIYPVSKTRAGKDIIIIMKKEEIK